MFDYKLYKAYKYFEYFEYSQTEYIFLISIRLNFDLRIYLIFIFGQYWKKNIFIFVLGPKNDIRHALLQLANLPKVCGFCAKIVFHRKYIQYNNKPGRLSMLL